jgi:outer membrane lipoprotein-sorting protein
MTFCGIGRIAGLVLFTSLATAAVAQTANPPPQSQPQPQTQTQTQAPQASSSVQTTAKLFDERQLDAIKQVTGYFNTLAGLKAQFVQTNPDGKRLRGKLAVKRPGRFRFDYNLPSRQVVVSDGRYLAVQDLDIKTDDRYELDRTPFRMLLRKDVDLVKDANILDVQTDKDLIIITIEDKSPDTPGRIKLFLVTQPQLELKEWVTTDAQNLDTKVELTAVDMKEEVDAKLFEIRSVALEKLQ